MQAITQAVNTAAIPANDILIFVAGFIVGVWLTYTIVKGVYKQKVL